MVRALLPDVAVLSCRREVSFRYQNMAVFQIQLAKRIDAVPLTRDYLYVHERGEERAGAARGLTSVMALSAGAGVL